MLFQILPIFWIIAICAKIPMTKKLIMKFPIISKIWLMLLKFIKDLDIKGMYSSPNNLTGFSSDMGNHRRDDERSTSPSYFYLPYNIYYESDK
ncbi:unknown (plasmid) [Rickettsia felis URRWXCal2]|uniref:Uncharacterized protein n=2 Tax=Rickettsia felis TaxID=42862 RepID=Q4UJB7_RICFE|nr:unknown [Rickettsia felis URRWXCal2]AAY62340.1 unknown [Rickettsia felis URRWXCal2]KHO02209.1 hypothetical protein JS55_08180 [Rickettsia felis str. LSU]KHO02235.1 hypothetical protein JS61_07815 [Rickettsia felis]